MERSKFPPKSLKDIGRKLIVDLVSCEFSCKFLVSLVVDSIVNLVVISVS